MRHWRRGELVLDHDALVFTSVDSIERFSVITTRVFNASEYADKARFVLSIVAPESNVLVEFNSSDDMQAWQEKVRVAKRQFQVSEMRKSVADVQHTIEAQLRPMIIERQSIIEKALSESDVLVESSEKFEVSLSPRHTFGLVSDLANGAECETQEVFSHALEIPAVCKNMLVKKY